jgi:hypothetical protein
VSRGLLRGLRDPAVGVVVGKAMGAEEDGDGAIWILVNPDDDGLDEVRSQAARRQLQAEALPLRGIVVADGAVLRVYIAVAFPSN